MENEQKLKEAIVLDKRALLDSLQRVWDHVNGFGLLSESQEEEACSNAIAISEFLKDIGALTGADLEALDTWRLYKPTC